MIVTSPKMIASNSILPAPFITGLEKFPEKELGREVRKLIKILVIPDREYIYHSVTTCNLKHGRHRIQLGIAGEDCSRHIRMTTRSQSRQGCRPHINQGEEKPVVNTTHQLHAQRFTFVMKGHDQEETQEKTETKWGGPHTTIV